MADFLREALRLRPGGAPAWLDEQRKLGEVSWQAQTWPTRKTEAWKYTRLRALEEGPYLAGTGQASDGRVDEALRRHYTIGGLDATTLVFVNGHYSAALSSRDLPDGVELVQFADANADQQARIRAHLGSVADRDRHLFTALSDLWLADGIYLGVARGAALPSALQVVWLTLPQSEPYSLNHRLLLFLDEGSEATVVEHFVSDEAEQNSFTNSVTEIVVGANAHLSHYRLHLEEEHALHIGSVHARLQRDARFDAFHLAGGGPLKRLDVTVQHDGEGAACNLNGVYLPRHGQHIDYHTCVEHKVPRCQTSEIFRGIVSDEARAVFNGRIHIHPDAQQTKAELSNRNLLTSDKAEVNTKPELEIYADDVQCAHGATVAQIDEEALYYLRSRGVSAAEARVMLSFGFINELVERLPDEAVAAYLRPILAQTFAADGRLARHIE